MRDLGKMMKQVQKLQQDVARLQEELKAERVEATAGGGVVRAVANGHGELQEVTIDPSVVDPSDIGLLQDLVVAAVAPLRGSWWMLPPSLPSRACGSSA